jgi:hypothetical protein
MKKIVLSLLVIVAFVITSCEKEDYKRQSTLTNIEKAPDFKYVLRACDIEVNDVPCFGIKCTDATYRQCPVGFPCQAVIVNGDPIPLEMVDVLQDLGFTDCEINAWINGEFEEVLLPTDEFIENHYAFYLALYEQELSFHPEALMKFN